MPTFGIRKDLAGVTNDLGGEKFSPWRCERDRRQKGFVSMLRTGWAAKGPLAGVRGDLGYNKVCSLTLRVDWRQKIVAGRFGGMVKGIGIDTVEIARMRARCARSSGKESAFFQRTFTDAERAEAAQRHDAAAYYAGRFAVKEAVYKAIAHLTDTAVLDFRSVETLADAHGCPHVVPSERLAQALEEAGVTELLVSLTNEGEYATAIVLAQ